MRVLHVVAGVAPGGGMAESVPALCRHQVQAGASVTLATLAGDTSASAAAAQRDGVRLLQYRTTGPAGLFFSWQMLRRLYGECCQADVVHVHGGWSFPVWWGCQCALRAGKVLIRSPRATFDPVRLQHSAWKKRPLLPLERRLLRRAHALHATSAAEARDLAACLPPKKDTANIPPIKILPNGVAIPALTIVGERDPRRQRQVIYLGRNHPLKGLDLLMVAWEQEQKPGWQLTLYGAGLPGGLVQGAAKETLLANADLLVLPSRSENFGIVVAEALAYGVPVIATRATPWSLLQGAAPESDSGGEPRGACGWWVETSVAGIAGALRAALNMSDAQRAALGANGRQLAQEMFQWEAISAAMLAFYRETRDRCGC